MDLIFNRGIAIPEFAAHTLLRHDIGRMALRDYFKQFLNLARERRSGFVLDAPTWKAHRHWADALGESPASLELSNRNAITFTFWRKAIGGNAFAVSTAMHRAALTLNWTPVTYLMTEILLSWRHNIDR